MSATPFPNGQRSPGNGSSPAPGGAIAPPHNLEAEQSVLGAILLSDRPMYALVIEENLRPEAFYRERHRLIYDARLSLYHDGEPIDVVTVTDRLRQAVKFEDAGGPTEVDEWAVLL